MVKKKVVEKSEDKFFKFFLIGFVLIVVIAAIFVNMKDNEPIVINDGDVVMHYFYLETCTHCKDQEAFHPVLLEKYPNLKIVEHELTKTESREKYMELAPIAGLDVEQVATPTTVIGNQSNVGFGNAFTTGPILEAMIEKQIEINSQK